MINRVYLDHHTATRPFTSSVEAMLPFFRDHWGSTTSPHQMGQELLPKLIHSDKTILNSLGSREQDRFYFFSSSSEAIHQLFLSHYFESIRQTGKNHILTTNVEEASILMSLKRLGELGCGEKIIPVNQQGQLNQEMLANALSPRTSMVSISWANGLTGVIHPIADLAEICRASNVHLHVDASYVIGKQYFRFEDLNIDFLTFEGSLLHAPKGTAGLIVKEKTVFSHPISSMLGVSVGGMAALAQALEGCWQMFDHLCLETARLRDKLEKGILNGFPEARLLFQNVERLPNCCAIIFPGIVSEALLFLLHRKGIYASIGGGHCQKLSHILIACGVDEVLAQSALSFSLSFETTEQEIDCAIKIILESVQQLKNLSGSLLEGLS